MSDTIRRSTRVVKSKEEEKRVEPPRKWSKEETKKILDCIVKHGHKDVKKIQECVPGRSIENIRTFLRTAYDKGTKKCEGSPVLDSWIHRCIGETPIGESPWRDSIQIAQTLKYLSVDGLVENHPLPEACEGINFPEAYRFLYQLVMGYPVQPVSKPTLSFICKTINDLKNEVKSETKAISTLKSYLANNFGKEETPTTDEKPNKGKQNVKSYQRKRRNPLEDTKAEEPSLKITVQGPKDDENNPEISHTKDYSVTFEGTAPGSQPTVLNVPVPVAVPVINEQEVDEDEKKLIKSKSYNPLRIPEKWLEEPLYANLSKIF